MLVTSKESTPSRVRLARTSASSTAVSMWAAVALSSTLFWTDMAIASLGSGLAARATGPTIGRLVREDGLADGPQVRDLLRRQGIEQGGADLLDVTGGGGGE